VLGAKRQSLNGNRNHVWITTSAHIVIRDSFFYGTHNAAELSYGVEPLESSDALIENNIFDGIASPLLIANGAGSVVAYISRFTTSIMSAHVDAGEPLLS